MQCVYGWYLLKVLKKQRHSMHCVHLKLVLQLLKSRKFHYHLMREIEVTGLQASRFELMHFSVS